MVWTSPPSEEAVTELEGAVVAYPVNRWARPGTECSAMLSEQPYGSTATLRVGEAYGTCFAMFEPDRWGRYVVWTRWAGESVLEYWPVAYRGVVGYDLGIPIAGPHYNAVALYAIPGSDEAGAWFTAAATTGGYVRGLSSDGLAFTDLEPGENPEATTTPGTDLDLPGFGRSIRLPAAAWVIHARYGLQDGTLANLNRFYRWTAEHFPTVALPGWSRRIYTLDEDASGAALADWEADSFDGYTLGTYHAIEEEVDGGWRIVMAYTGDLTPDNSGTGANTIRILHADYDFSIPDLGSFYRPDCDPATMTTAELCAARTSCDPLGFWCGTQDEGRRTDTPWFFPTIVDPFRRDHLRLTALFQPLQTEPTTLGWASWRREVGAGEETWVFEGNFFDLEQIAAGLESDGEMTGADRACLMGDHTIATVEGGHYLYVPVDVFRGYWDPHRDPSVTTPSELSARNLAYVRFHADVVTAVRSGGASVQVRDDAGNNAVYTYGQLLDELGFASLNPFTGEPEVDFDCTWCVAVTNLDGKNPRLPLEVTADAAGNITSVTLTVDPLTSTVVRADPCRITPEEGLAELFAARIDESTVPDKQVRLYAGRRYAAVCRRFCFDIPLVLATTGAVG